MVIARLEDEFVEEERLQSLGRLAGGIAHDFNNLLTVISNYSAFVAGAIEDALQTGSVVHLVGAAHDIEQIEQAAERASARTRQLLSFARRDVARPTLLDISEVVHGALPALRGLCGEAILLTTTLAAELPEVFADPAQLDDALMNVAANACDAMPRGGELQIVTRAASRGDVAGVELLVHDSGIGMTEDVRVLAFEPFFTTKDFGEGAGLGLATVHGIVSRAGGTVSIDSIHGQGTTVSIWLPARDLPLWGEGWRPSHSVGT